MHKPGHQPQLCGRDPLPTLCKEKHQVVPSSGHTGLQVSRVCLGTMYVGPQTSETDSFAIMDHALEQGINFIETAYAW